MGLSKAAKRGITIFNHLKSKTNKWRYSAKQMSTMIDLNRIEGSVIQAGVDAIAAMRGNANAIQKLSNSEGYTVTTHPERRAECGIPVQPETSKEDPQRTDASTEGPK